MSTYPRSDSSLADPLWREFKERPTVDLRNQLVERYMPLVHFHAEQYRQRLPARVELDDLVSAGSVGLIGAVEAFDASKGVKFETFSWARIRGAMADDLRAKEWAPRLLRSDAARIAAARAGLESRYGRGPIDIELSGELDMSLREYYDMEKACRPVAVATLPGKRYVREKGKLLLDDAIYEDARAETPARRLQRKDLMRLVTRGANRNERFVIIMYYYDHQSLKEIGASLGLCESRVSQIRAAVLTRLRDALAARRSEFEP